MRLHEHVQSQILIYGIALEWYHSHSLAMGSVTCVTSFKLQLLIPLHDFWCNHALNLLKEGKGTDKFPIRNSNNLRHFQQMETKYLSFRELLKTYVGNNGSCNIQSKTHSNVLERKEKNLFALKVYLIFLEMTSLWAGSIRAADCCF